MDGLRKTEVAMEWLTAVGVVMALQRLAQAMAVLFIGFVLVAGGLLL